MDSIEIPLSVLSEKLSKKKKGAAPDDVDDDNSMDRMNVLTFDEATGSWSCHPYKRDILGNNIQHANANGKSRHDATLETLANMGVHVYIVQASSPDVLRDILRAVDDVVRVNQTSPRTHQRCLLYEDTERRLFNVILPSHAVGPASEFISGLESFSGAQAMAALVVLCRSLPCAFEDDIGQLQPALLSLVLGLVLSEEVALSWVNASMLVRAMPSMSGYSLTSKLGSDWIRKLMVLMLAMAGAANGKTQKYLTLLGVTLACSILLANLGSRAWYFLNWKPLAYNGPLASVLAYLCAIGAGICLPYMGHVEIEAGGKRALEAVVLSALFVAAFFCISDLNDVQRFLVIGSDSCPQNTVNMVIGTWWTGTLLACMGLVLKIQPYRLWVNEEEPLLEHDSASPVGYKVPNLPDFIVDPNLVQKDRFPFPMCVEVMLGFVLAVGIGGCMVYLAITEWDDILAMI